MSHENKIKRDAYIMEIYEKVKQSDIADTFIVSKIFPKYHIHIDYYTFMRIKHPKTKKEKKDDSLPGQMTIFDVIEK